MASAGGDALAGRVPDGGPEGRLGRNLPVGAGHLGGSSGARSSARAPVVRIASEVYSRAGLLGNPSDAFGGAALAILASNYGAGVVLEAREADAESLTLVPDPQADATSFASLGALEQRVSDHGYYGGIRLLAAACVAFQRWVASREQAGERGREGREDAGRGGDTEQGADGLGGDGLEEEVVGSSREGGGSPCVPESRPCPLPAALLSPPARLAVSISYWSSIPRQSGMSGSSAIVLAALDALARLHAWREGFAPAELERGAGERGSDRPGGAGARADVPSAPGPGARRPAPEAVYSVPASAGERVLPRLARPGIALGAEESLGIAAGWMDRIIQSFGGSVLLDLGRDGRPSVEEEKDASGGKRPTERKAEQEGREKTGTSGAPSASAPSILVTRVPTTRLPPLFLLRFPSIPPRKDSGSVHADVRRRWKAGEPEVVAAMARLAEIARKGARILRGDEDAQGEGGRILRGDEDAQGEGDGAASASLRSPSSRSSALAALVDENFGIRLALYGPARLGPVNLRLRAIAEAVGASATLAGSGGTLIAVCPAGERQEQQLVRACQAQGAVAERLVPAPALVDVPRAGIAIN